MNKLLIPFFIVMVCILGFSVYHESESRQKQEIDRLVSEAHTSLQQIEADAHAKKILIKKDSVHDKNR